jgi:hypothetical protein
MSTTCKIPLFALTTVGLLWASAFNARGQEFSPPPGFSPGAPTTTGNTPTLDSGTQPGFLQRFGTTPNNDPYTVRDEDFLGTEDQPSPKLRPSRRSTPTTRPASSYTDNGYVPPEHGPLLIAPEPFAPRIWLRAEALVWWTKDSPLPAPLVTTGSTGIIGTPDTAVLIGSENIGLPTRGGGRFTLGFALDEEAIWALESNYFFLGAVTVSEGASSDGSTGSSPLYVPYFNTTTRQEDATFIANPGMYAGTAVLTLQDFVQGAEANLLRNFSRSGQWSWDGLAGFRYVNLHEVLTFTTDSPNVPPSAPAYFQTFDRFDAQNNFYGGQLGVRGNFDNSYLFFNGTFKLALGGTLEGVSTTGALYSSFGSAAGGYLTQPSNLGSLSQSHFAVIPSLDLNFGIHIGPRASLVVGYSFLYISSVARPGDQIDHNINPSQSPLAFGNQPPSNSASPALILRDTDFWLQGLTFAVDLRF